MDLLGRKSDISLARLESSKSEDSASDQHKRIRRFWNRHLKIVDRFSASHIEDDIISEGMITTTHA